MTTEGQDRWALATLALDLLAIDPAGLGGLVMRARSGPVRDRLVEALDRLPDRPVRLHPAMPREALFGGLDLTATLSANRLIETPGLLEQPITPVLAMAERCTTDRAAEIAAWMDRTHTPLILMDEGAEPGETVPAVLSERTAFHVSLDDIGRLEAKPPAVQDYAPARARLKAMHTPKTALPALTTLAMQLGIDSLRAPSFALRAARALAALHERDEVSDSDVETAARLVLAPRATRFPPEETQPPQDQSETQQDQENRNADGADQVLPQDMLVDAIRPDLPADLLELMAAKASRSSKGSGAGSKRKSNRRGRPLPSRPGRLGNGTRVDLVATLRCAAPWQTLRRRGDGAVKVFPSDIRVRRYEEKSDRLLVFAVDASGSAAMARLAEAKGAVEILLAQAYASRDHVSLIAFRGEAADVLLPPSRSLVQTKRRLAALPGGGGTPLAAGLRAAGELALHARAQGLSPTLALLTDGRANIALNGAANRAEARTDAVQMARWLRSEGIPAIVLDTARRPDPSLKTLSDELSARYIPLPHADARVMSQALGQAIGDGLGG